MTTWLVVFILLSATGWAFYIIAAEGYRDLAAKHGAALIALDETKAALRLTKACLDQAERELNERAT